MPENLLALVLGFACLSLFLGLLGGWGGRMAALMMLRRELAALAASVDIEAPSKLASATLAVQHCERAIESCRNEVKSLSGKFGADERKTRSIQPQDLEFITAHVGAQVLRRLREAAVAPAKAGG